MPIYNVNDVKQSVSEKITATINKQCERFGGPIDPKISIEITGDFVFAVSHACVPTSTDNHRYDIFVFNAVGIELLHHDGNFIDKTVFVTIRDVITRAKVFFSRYSKLIDKYT